MSDKCNHTDDCKIGLALHGNCPACLGAALAAAQAELSQHQKRLTNEVEMYASLRKGCVNKPCYHPDQFIGGWEDGSYHCWECEWNNSQAALAVAQAELAQNKEKLLTIQDESGDWEDIATDKTIEVDAWREVTGCSTPDEAARLRPNPCAKIFDHKWLDPVCVEGGCQSLFLKHARERIGVLEAALREACDKCEYCGGTSHPGKVMVNNNVLRPCGICSSWRAALRPEATIGGGLAVEPKEMRNRS